MSQVQITIESDGHVQRHHGEAVLLVILADQGNAVQAGIVLRTPTSLAPVLAEAVEQELRELKEKIVLHALARLSAQNTPSVALN